jgi:hypothetical protein
MRDTMISTVLVSRRLNSQADGTVDTTPDFSNRALAMRQNSEA